MDPVSFSFFILFQITYLLYINGSESFVFTINGCAVNGIIVYGYVLYLKNAKSITSIFETPISFKIYKVILYGENFESYLTK